MHIKIIDDDYGDAQQLKNRLFSLTDVKSVGANFGHAGGVNLVTYLNGKKPLFPKLVILEAKYNDGSAIELIRAFRKIKGMSNSLIVVYTGTDDVEAKQACLAAGANQLFEKTPTGLEELVNYVSNLSKS